MMKLHIQLLHVANATPLDRVVELCTSLGNAHAMGPHDIP